MDNTFLVEEDYPAGTKLLVYNGEDENGNIQTFPRILTETTRLIPPRYYLGRRIEAIDLSEITDNETRERIENKRAMAWQDQARRRINDNNNVDPAPVPVRMDDDAIPAGRAFRVPSGGRKSRRGRKSKKSRKRRSKKRRSRKTIRRRR
jgi:hypothetical protein